jgi:hypothetical protein
MATVEADLSHSWFRYILGRLPTAVVAFSMVLGLPRGPGVHFGMADQMYEYLKRQEYPPDRGDDRMILESIARLSE